jgi:tetratricopeptide (TPR) repeat protein
VGDNRVLLHRMPRDFKWQANRLFHESLNLNDQGERALALKKAKQALDIYPYQLKGLILMGILLRQAGDMRHALSFLGFAAQAYPQDAATQFDLALAQDSPNKIEQLRRVIDLDPDILAAYQTLGAALEASGDRVGAIEAYRAGLKIDPLSAALYYDLSLALKEQGNATGAANALTLATRIDSKVANPLGR